MEGQIMFLETALEYKERGFSIIPIIEGTKKPLVKWEMYQKQRATKEQIIEWWTKTPNANIGIVTGEISDLFVIDIDTEEGFKNLEGIIPDALVLPTVQTPRGGQHLYFSYPVGSGVTIGVNKIPGTDFRGNGGFVVAPPSVNGTGKPYSWLIPLGDAQLMPPPAAYITKTIFMHGVDTTSCSKFTTNTTQHYTILQKGTRDDDLFYCANQLLKGGRDEGFVRQVMEILADNCNPPFPKNEMEIKILSAVKRGERREHSLMDEVREWILLQEGNFFTTDILQTLQLTTKEDKKNLTVILSRLNNEGIIERHGERRGSYRTKTQDKKEMDLKTESVLDDVDIKLPLQLNDMCVLSPGNIIVVAGSKSAGKTAFMLNVAAFNQNKFDVVYLNSEMSDSEFKKRMKKIMPLSDWNIRAYKCHNDFDDYIESNPKKLYIIDFLEVHDNFYEIAKPIRKVHEKLGESLCFVAIHMKLGNTLGRGGDFSAEKARLYLTMDYIEGERKSKVTIYDAKEPRPPHESVRGMHRMIKIVNGSELHYTPIDNWRW